MAIVVLGVVCVVVMGFGLGGRGAAKSQLLTISLILLIADFVLALMTRGLKVALVTVGLVWGSGTVIGLVLDTKYHGFEAIENASSKRDAKRIMRQIRKSK